MEKMGKNIKCLETTHSSGRSMKYIIDNRKYLLLVKLILHIYIYLVVTAISVVIKV